MTQNANPFADLPTVRQTASPKVPGTRPPGQQPGPAAAQDSARAAQPDPSEKFEVRPGTTAGNAGADAKTAAMPNLTVRFDAFMQAWSAGLFRTLIVIVEQAVAGATALLKDPSIAWQVAGDMVFEVLLVCLENTRRGRGDGFAIQTRNTWMKRMDSSIPKPPMPEPTIQP